MWRTMLRYRRRGRDLNPRSPQGGTPASKAGVMDLATQPLRPSSSRFFHLLQQIPETQLLLPNSQGIELQEVPDHIDEIRAQVPLSLWRESLVKLLVLHNRKGDQEGSSVRDWGISRQLLHGASHTCPDPDGSCSRHCYNLYRLLHRHYLSLLGGQPSPSLNGDASSHVRPLTSYWPALLAGTGRCQPW